MAPTQALSLQHTHLVQEKMLQLGWLVNLKKSQLNPSQSIEHLGMNLDTKNMSISIPGKKIRSIRRQAYQLLYQTQVKVKQLAAFIGSALATQLGNQQARFRTRHLVAHLNQARSSNPHQWTQICTITPLMRKDLLWWITQLRHWNGRQMLPHRPTIQVFTDSSDRGWGIVHEDQQYQGQWTNGTIATYQLQGASRCLENAIDYSLSSSPTYSTVHGQHFGNCLHVVFVIFSTLYTQSCT
jgi:hypothetical protein